MFIITNLDAYETKDLWLKWRDGVKEVEVNPKISLPEYVLQNVTSEICSKKFSSTGAQYKVKAIVEIFYWGSQMNILAISRKIIIVEFQVFLPRNKLHEIPHFCRPSITKLVSS